MNIVKPRGLARAFRLMRPLGPSALNFGGLLGALAAQAVRSSERRQVADRAFIRGDPANVRTALYMPALVAIRFNPHLKKKYSQLIAAGKPAKAAITAIMRKMIVLANALLRAKRKWEPKAA